MPKIVITEKDLTSAGVAPYTNFAVALPCYVAREKEDAFLAAADENGVLELSDADDFENLVGKVAISEAPAELAVSPTCTFGPSLFENIPDGKTAEEQFNYYKRFDHASLRHVINQNETDEVYFEFTKIYLYPNEGLTLHAIKADESTEITFTVADDSVATYANNIVSALTPGETTIIGTYVDSQEQQKTIVCTIVVESRPSSPAKLYYCSANTNGQAGYLKSTLYIFNPVEEDTAFSATTLYARIEDGDNQGIDAIAGAHYGNQIAYELINMGYTVLLKGLSLDEKLSTLNSYSWWKCLEDKSIYDFRYIINGLLTDESGNYKTSCDNFISQLATKRGDCTALVDINEYKYRGLAQDGAIEPVIADANAHNNADKYTAIFAPCVTFSMSDDEEYGNNKTFPGYFYYLACASYASETFNEWYAIAGYTRGICKYSIAAVGCKFGEAAIQELEPRVSTNGLGKSVNLITKVKKSFYLWGNRTAEPLVQGDLTSGGLRASHFLNIRQLCSTIKKDVYVACRRMTFDPNSDLLWVNFCNAIRPTLEKMKGDQGVTDYRFVKVKATRKGILTARIKIIPIEAVEDFEIELQLRDSLDHNAAVDIDEID